MDKGCGQGVGRSKRDHEGRVVMRETEARLSDQIDNLVEGSWVRTTYVYDVNHDGCKSQHGR